MNGPHHRAAALLLLLACPPLPASSATTSSALVNGDFENGLDGWTVSVSPETIMWETAHGPPPPPQYLDD